MSTIAALPTYTVFQVNVGTFIHLGRGIVLPLGSQDSHRAISTERWPEDTQVTILAEAVER